MEEVVQEPVHFHHPALQQVGWLGHNDKNFYSLDDGPICVANNRGGFSPIYRQVGTYKYNDEVKKWILHD